MEKDVFITDSEYAVFGEGRFACMIKHNEDGAELMFTLPCGVVPVACFTDFDNSSSNLLFIAMRDFPEAEVCHFDYHYDEKGEVIVETVKAGGVYYVGINHVEDMEPAWLCEDIDITKETVRAREDHDDTEWMDGMVARLLCHNA